jgi:hypothetical protein
MVLKRQIRIFSQKTKIYPEKVGFCTKGNWQTHVVVDAVVVVVGAVVAVVGAVVVAVVDVARLTHAYSTWTQGLTVWQAASEKGPFLTIMIMDKEKWAAKRNGRQARSNELTRWPPELAHHQI